jgi:hypothetical protein
VAQPKYIEEIPERIPDGFIVVHNAVRTQRPLSHNGFQAWLEAEANAKFRNRIVCDCGWAPQLGTHYTVVDPFGRSKAKG